MQSKVVNAKSVMTVPMINFKNFFEKTVIGLIEEMEIAGIGRVKVKIDSGNSAYNVLGVSNIMKQGNKVTFDTINGKRLIKEIKDTITINVGAGNEEERQVVMFRIKFGGQEFDNIPFSLGNRDNNEYKVLVGKDFIKKLDALIDVSLNNVANKQVKVEYDTNPETV